MTVRRIAQWALANAIVWSAALSSGTAAVRADDSVGYSPNPAYAGAFEQFNACGFEGEETVDLMVDGNAAANTPASGGCAYIPFLQLPLDITPTTHTLSMKGRSSGTEQVGILVVMPPAIVSASATVPGGTTTIVGQFFAPGRTPLLIPNGGLVPGPGVTDGNGQLIASLTALPDAAPGAYPVLIQDDPWLVSPPPLVIVVNPKPSASPSAAGGWLLHVTSTLAKDDEKPSVKGNGSFDAPFTVSNGQLNGQGQLTMAIDINGGDASCHGDGHMPFQVGGAQNGDTFHLIFTGLGASIPVTVTCNNGITMPFALPGGSDSATFDVQASDGQTIDLDGSNLFMMVPNGFSGHSHAVLTKA